MAKHLAVLFVCLGNICRSPLAEAAFRKAVSDAGLDVEIDSAGTGDWHIGKGPDPRAQATAMRYGIDISAYRARQVEASDFQRFTHIFALDHDNLEALQTIAPVTSRAELALLLDSIPDRIGQGVADPYFGDEAGFEVTWADVTTAAQALVIQLQA